MNLLRCYGGARDERNESSACSDLVAPPVAWVISELTIQIYPVTYASTPIFEGVTFAVKRLFQNSFHSLNRLDARI